MAERIAAENPEVSRVLLFGSHARGDFGARSDIDLLVVLRRSSLPLRERIAALLPLCSTYPTDVFPLTECELAERLRAGDPFWTRAMEEAIDCTGGQARSQESDVRPVPGTRAG